MKHLIVGIDPGTTTGYAIFDTKGNLVEVNSIKNAGFNKIIKKLYDFGKPLLIGCDKKNVPSFVKELSSKTGGILVSPDHDIKLDEKREMLDRKNRNDHEDDAYISAILAIRKYYPTLQKIHSFSMKSNLPVVRMENLVLKKGNNITRAAEIINEKEIKILKKRSKQEVNVRKLINRINEMQEDNDVLRKKIKELKEIINKKNDLLLKGPNKKISKDISNYTKQINVRDKIIKALEEKNEKLNNILDQLSKNILIRKIKHLNKYHEENILFVNNPQNFSRKAVDKLKETCDYIITPQSKLPKLPFVFIPSKDLIIEETDDFVLINKEKLNLRINKKKMFENIVKEYQKDRR